MSESISTSLLGKMPARADFVRSGVSGAADMELEAWMMECVEQSRGQLPSVPVRFLFTPRAASPLIGTWVPSRDAIGRTFPLMAARPLASELSGAYQRAIPAYYAGFLQRSEACLRQGTLGSSLEWLRSTIDKIETPHVSTIPGVLSEEARILSEQHVSAFSMRAFGPASHSALPYALDTVHRALQRRDQDADLTLDVPTAGDADLSIWLVLLMHLSRGEARPSVVLWAHELGRTLIAFGPPHRLLLSFLLDREHPSRKRWPLWTTQSEAERVAHDALPVATREAIRRDISLRELLNTLEPGAIQ